MAFCHNSISLSATAPVLPVELQMIFTIDTFTDLPHHISISMVHGIFTICMKKSDGTKILENYWYYSRRFESIVKISAWQENFVGAVVCCTGL